MQGHPDDGAVPGGSSPPSRPMRSDDSTHLGHTAMPPAIGRLFSPPCAARSGRRRFWATASASSRKERDGVADAAGIGLVARLIAPGSSLKLHVADPLADRGRPADRFRIGRSAQALMPAMTAAAAGACLPVVSALARPVRMRISMYLFADRAAPSFEINPGRGGGRPPLGGRRRLHQW